MLDEGATAVCVIAHFVHQSDEAAEWMSAAAIDAAIRGMPRR